jgi:hypothetical protein
VVECDLAKVEVAGSNPVSRSSFAPYGGSCKPVPAANLPQCIGTTNGDCNGNIGSVASVNNGGLALCLPGASGTALVLAGTGGHATNPDGGFPLRVVGSAQLTCP